MNHLILVIITPLIQLLGAPHKKHLDDAIIGEWNVTTVEYLKKKGESSREKKVVDFRQSKFEMKYTFHSDGICVFAFQNKDESQRKISDKTQFRYQMNGQILILTKGVNKHVAQKITLTGDASKGIISLTSLQQYPQVKYSLVKQK